MGPKQEFQYLRSIGGGHDFYFDLVLQRDGSHLLALARYPDGEPVMFEPTELPQRYGTCAPCHVVEQSGPPTAAHYVASITSCFQARNPFEIVISGAHVWLFRPNRAFVKFFRSRQDEMAAKHTLDAYKSIKEYTEIQHAIIKQTGLDSLGMIEQLGRAIQVPADVTDFYVESVGKCVDGLSAGFDVYCFEIDRLTPASFYGLLAAKKLCVASFY